MSGPFSDNNTRRIERRANDRQAILQADNAAMRTLLTELAQDACEKCEEKDCADCWAMDYHVK